jgi:hypothetical protein
LFGSEALEASKLAQRLGGGGEPLAWLTGRRDRMVPDREAEQLAAAVEVSTVTTRRRLS